MLTRLALSMRSRRKLALTLTVATLLSSCGGNGNNGGGGGGVVTPAPTPTPTTTAAAECSLRTRQDWALAQLQEWYLFPTLLDSTVNPAAHATLQSYIDALVAPARAQNKDRYFTYATSMAQENAFYERGASAGFGIRLSYDTAARRVFVIEAFEGAPALGANIDRGTEIIAIGAPGGAQQSVNSLMATGGPAAVVNALGSDTVGLTRVLRVRDPSGVEREVTLAKAEFNLDPVSNRYGAKILVEGARRIGYVNLRTFITSADPDLRAAFADFKAQGVTELIIDLRYNGGGLVSISDLMIDLMGLGRDGEVSGFVTYRDSKASQNSTFRIGIQPQSISPTKVAFIGTGSTASASELLINGMQPFLRSNMALIGSNTYGKPVGQIALDRPACNDRLRAIAFKVENADHQGEYFNGLATTVPNTCRASDDVTHQLGDPNETMIKTALDFLAGRACTPIGTVGTASAAARGVLVPDAPANTIQRELSGAY
jgi:C-terminal processing protease CtpA/Prc